mgnify:CR=1 FL=1|jgi:uncharacterized protein
MIVPDINLLVYAYNQGATEHERAKLWWEECLNGSTIIGLSWITAAGFIRLMTHPKVLTDPMPVKVAVGHVNVWMDQPPVRILNPGPRFSRLFFESLKHLGTGGNLTTDAQLAALAAENQAELHSADGDFSRFPGLRWKNPLKKN